LGSALLRVVACGEVTMPFVIVGSPGLGFHKPDNKPSYFRL